MAVVEQHAAAARFRALGTYAHVATEGGAVLAEAERIVRGVLAEVDRACSRFREDSDLTRANRSPGERVQVDPLLVSAVRAAIDVAAQTDGLVDPLLGRTLVQLGYDRDLALLRETDAPRRTPASGTRGAWRHLEVGEDWVRVPDGTALDLGSTGKAWASDVAAGTAYVALGVPLVVGLGGDVAVAGEAARPWPVEVHEHPDSAVGARVGVSSGGLATSSTRVRRWRQGGVERHHLLDPRTQAPATEVWRTVTATGPSCVAANGAATATIVLGHDAPAWLEARGVDARLVGADGRVRLVGRWPEEAR